MQNFNNKWEYFLTLWIKLFCSFAVGVVVVVADVTSRWDFWIHVALSLDWDWPGNKGKTFSKTSKTGTAWPSSQILYKIICDAIGNCFFRSLFPIFHLILVGTWLSSASSIVECRMQCSSSTFSRLSVLPECSAKDSFCFKFCLTLAIAEANLGLLNCQSPFRSCILVPLVKIKQTSTYLS